LPRIAAEYINLVIKKMKYSRKARREVRQELIDHFTDALEAIEDQTERERIGKELVEQFGDVRMLGTLLRRGKKRCRPMWKKVIVRGLQFLLVIYVALIFYNAWIIRTWNKDINYIERFNKLNRPVADEQETHGIITKRR